MKKILLFLLLIPFGFSLNAQIKGTVYIKKAVIDTAKIKILRAYNDSSISLRNAIFNTTLFNSWTNSTAVNRGASFAQYSTDLLPSKLFLQKARGTFASPTTLVKGDTIGKVILSGYEGSKFYHGASITALTTGTISTNILATDLLFSTTSNTGALSEKMRIDKDGNVGIGNILDKSCAPNYTTTRFGLRFSIVSYNLGTTSLFSEGAYYDGGGLWKAYSTTASSDFVMASGTFAIRTAVAVAADANTSPITKFKVFNDGTIAIGSHTPTLSMSFLGTAAKTFGIEANTATSAGSNFTINAGGNTAGGTANLNGGMLILSPGLAKDTGYASVRITRNLRSATSGTALNTLQDAVIVMSSNNLTDNTAKPLFSVALATDAGAGGTIQYSITAVDGDTTQTYTGSVNYQCVNMNGNVVVEFENIGSSTEYPLAVTDMAVTWSANTSASSVDIKCTADVAFIPTNIKIYSTVFNNSLSTITQK